jgi:hypothetical protein
MMVRHVLLDDYIDSRVDGKGKKASWKTPKLDFEIGIIACHYLWVKACTMFNLSLGPLLDA